MEKLLQVLRNLDRRYIYLLVGLGTIVPLIHPLNLPVSITKPVQDSYDIVDKLGPEDAVLMSFDYGPSSAPENDPMGEAMLRHCFERRIKVIVIALYPLGGVTMADMVLARVVKDYQQLQDGVDYVHMGYKDGGQAVMRALNERFSTVFPVNRAKKPIAEIPLMQLVKNYKNIKLVASLATGIIGEWWANLVHEQFGVPVVVGCTAVSAPKYYAYYKAGQMSGLMGGVKAASEYEKLLLDNYPKTRPAYARVGVYNATKGMDVQSVVHLIIIAFIIIGNISYVLLRKRSASLSGHAHE